jgi:hypothetical protein
VTGRISGGGLTSALAVGGAITPNLIIGGQLWGTAVPRPKVTDSGAGGGRADPSNDFTYGVVGLGPIIKYYVMPANVYFAVTPSVACLTVTALSFDAEGTKWGLGLRLAAGKEGYVSERWGMGVAGVLDLASATAGFGAQDPTWRTVGGGIAFTASYR